jgi:putative solute:sodium symporter small subunit
MADFQTAGQADEARQGPPDEVSRALVAVDLTRHWRRTRLLTAALLCLWFCATFGIGFFARELEHIRFFGWPLSYYMGAQGSLIIFLGIIGFYALAMRRIDDEATRLAKDSSGEPH